MSPTLENLVGAQAKFVAFVASLLQRQGVISAAEFAELLAVFAASVASTDPQEGQLLAGWADEVFLGVASATRADGDLN